MHSVFCSLWLSQTTFHHFTCHEFKMLWNQNVFSMRFVFACSMNVERSCEWLQIDWYYFVMGSSRVSSRRANFTDATKGRRKLIFHWNDICTAGYRCWGLWFMGNSTMVLHRVRVCLSTTHVARAQVRSMWHRWAQLSVNISIQVYFQFDPSVWMPELRKKENAIFASSRQVDIMWIFE